MGRSKGEGGNVNKDIVKQKESKKQVVVGLVTSFSCPHCEKAFDQKTTLTKHLKSHQQLTDKTQGIKESKEDSGVAEEKENLPDKMVPVLKHLKVMKTKKLVNSKGSGNKSRLEVLRVSQVSSAMKSLISPASGGRSKVKRVLRKKSGSLLERPKLTSNDVIDPKLGTTPETEKVGNGSPGQSGLMYPGWHASAAGTISESRDLSVQIFGVTSALFLLVTRLKMGSPA